MKFSLETVRRFFIKHSEVSEDDIDELNKIVKKAAEKKGEKHDVSVSEESANVVICEVLNRIYEKEPRQEIKTDINSLVETSNLIRTIERFL